MSVLSPTAQRRANPELRRAYNREIYARTKGRVRAKMRARYAGNADVRAKENEAAKRWYRENPEKAKAQREADYRSNRDAYISRSRAARMRNPQRYLWALAKHGAKKRGIEFNLSPEDVIIPAHCPVFGLPLFIGTGQGKHDFSPSIDRIDNARGYVRGNIIVVSLLANRIKSNATPEQIKAVADFYLQLTSDMEAQVKAG